MFQPRGPYLRTQEGQESAILCNEDDALDASNEPTTRPDFEAVIVSAPGTFTDREAAGGMGLGCPSTSNAHDTEVVYTRERVAVWPTKKLRIMGRLSLIKQHAVLFLAWLPHSQGVLDPEGDSEPVKEAEAPDTPPSQDRTKYAVHPIPLSELKAVRKHTPKLGNQHIVLVQKNGLTLPPFYFTGGGVGALFSALKQHAYLSRSNDDPSTHLINDIADPLTRSLTTLEISDALMLDPARHPLASACSRDAAGEAGAGLPFMDRMLESVHRATQFARDRTSTFLVPSTSHQMPSKDAGARREAEATTGAETELGMFELVDRSESESMTSGLDQPCPPPLTHDEWFTFLDAAGRIVDEKALRKRIFYAGVEPGIRKEAWKFLLGMFPPHSTSAQRQSLLRSRAAEYERIKAQWTSITDAQAARFGKWRERKMRVDKDVRRTDCMHPFYAGEDNPNVAALQRILLTYSMYNFDLGYCQGMSDLASPILYVMRDEALAFWCFVSLMDCMEGNFSTSCTGMHSQLAALKNLVQLLDPQLHTFLEAHDCLNYFFCYRWLLVHFKREFPFNEGLQLWEALWSCHLTPHFHIFMCAAVLRMHRAAILAAQMSFDELLTFCIQLSGRLDLRKTMRCAEKLHKLAGAKGVECLRAADLAC